MSNIRDLLKEYVTNGKLLQLATLGSDGAPLTCSVWYDAHYNPDVLRWISRHDRVHSLNIARDPRVSGAIVGIPLEGLGQQVRGVSFVGRACQLPTIGVEEQIAQFLHRWPRAAAALDVHKLASGQTPSRLFEVQVTEWVLFDEVNFPSAPRQVVPGAQP